jgi:hypothetical protein
MLLAGAVAKPEAAAGKAELAAHAAECHRHPEPPFSSAPACATVGIIFHDAK